MSNILNLSKRTFLLLTGGSRGIGAKIAIEFSRKMPKDSQILLLARTTAGLDDTKQKILEANANIDVITHSIDLTNPSESEFREILKFNAANFDQAVVVHNAGSTGDVSKSARSVNDVNEWKDNFSMNVFSVVLLNNLFLEITSGVKQYIINITSKAAICPFTTFAFYCSNKAAREMFFKVLAEEEKDNSDLVILNYAPGPVDTEMLRTVGDNTFDAGFKTFIVEGIQNGSVLTTDQTVGKLLSILEQGSFSNGDHVDYYD